MDALFGTLVGGLITLLASLISHRAQERERKADRTAALEERRLQLQWEDEVASQERRRQAARRLLPLVVAVQRNCQMWMWAVNSIPPTQSLDEPKRKLARELLEKLVLELLGSTWKLTDTCAETLADAGPELFERSAEVIRVAIVIGSEFGTPSTLDDGGAQPESVARRTQAAAELQDCIARYSKEVATLAVPVTLTARGTD